MTLNDYFHTASVEQKAFARRIGISEALLSRIKTGSRKPNVAVAKKIEKATKGKVKAAVLMGLVKQ